MLSPPLSSCVTLEILIDFSDSHCKKAYTIIHFIDLLELRDWMLVKYFTQILIQWKCYINNSCSDAIFVVIISYTTCVFRKGTQKKIIIHAC